MNDKAHITPSEPHPRTGPFDYFDPQSPHQRFNLSPSYISRRRPGDDTLKCPAVPARHKGMILPAEPENTKGQVVAGDAASSIGRAIGRGFRIGFRATQHFTGLDSLPVVCYN